jgi:putative glutamine amidotransferase
MTRVTRPVIGLTTQTLHSIDGIPTGLPQSWVMNQRYFYAAAEAGGIPWMIPLMYDDIPTLREIYLRLDGLLIPGGVDMDPNQYGEDVRLECGNLDKARDAVEIQLTKWAIEDGKPVLGLCRGLQVINVAQGGSLYQDLNSQNPAFTKHDFFPTTGFERDYLAHEVDLTPGSRLQTLLHEPRVHVNSMHHQGIKKIGDALIAAAISDDGLIEAVEGEGDAFLIGVQWHPEVFEMENPQTRDLFGGFIRAACDWAEQHGSARRDA